jgi:cold shock CspA family protein
MPQGTVKHFDYETHTGTVLLDNADEVGMDAETFAASGLLELRLGQRVRFELDKTPDGPRMRELTLVSF